MFIDASVLVAITVGEPDAEQLGARLAAATKPFYVSPMVRFEATLAVARSAAAKRRAKPSAVEIGVARQLIDDLVARLGADSIALSDDVGDRAIETAMRYGKAVGHAADFNMGDCFAYACAKSLGVPLLHKGDDFARTDLA